MFAVAIPSYRRAKTLNQKTLTALKEEGFLPHTITVFVANQEEFDIYSRTLDQSLYGSLVIGRLGLTHQRQFISEYYPVGVPILQIDDDIRRFKKLGEHHLPTLFERVFEYCKNNQIPAFGLFPAANNFFLKDRYRLGFFYLVGSCFGILNTREIPYLVDCKEDYVRTFELYRLSKRLLRLDFLAADTSYWAGKGGMSVERTIEKEQKASEELAALYPEFVSEVVVKKKGRPDVKLRKFPAEFLPIDSI